MGREMILQTILLLIFFDVVIINGSPQCTEDTKVPFVLYCDLVHDPMKFDGHLVRTEAVWQRMINAGALADRSCAVASSEALLTLPSFSKDSNFNSSLRKELWKILDKDGAARVRITGTFHGPKGRPYAADGQKFQIEIACLLKVSPLKASDR